MNPTVRIFLGSRALAATFHLWKGLRMDWLKIQGESALIQVGQTLKVQSWGDHRRWDAPQRPLLVRGASRLHVPCLSGDT